MTQPRPPRDPGRIPGSIVIPNCVQVNLVWNLASGKQVINVMHAQVAAGFNATAAVAQAVFAAITGSASWTAYIPFLHSTVSFAGVQIRDLRTANLPLVLSTGGAVAGTGAGVAVPPGVCMTITEKTAQAGRGFRGRVYLPGWDSTAFVPASGAFLGTAQTAAVNFVGAVASAMLSNGMTQSIAQPARQAYTGRAGRAIVARLANVVNVTTNSARLTAATSQRRRSLVA